ncbi:protein FAR1-RELATED SEQUENCE 2-like [Cucumis melo var. makuwa]|uniref:Protein FAR1-RELATED SEQUENCE 2-like n=1 Tax=Cucumis melo var. makuwa TaxID=1194695 RepID=A0A5A7VGR4_CUCMM|nr:protein FAR1-RELATED SEQUENCE 2-like [Cucumis melo var. makuwa]TYJ97202.1 protein FAR1-RELATED SEQUENCE 2-like [Cucumis melo var. makuwa]
MALQRVKTVFHGRWIESCRYIDYRLLDVYVPVSSSFQEFVNCIQHRLFPNSEVSICTLTLYWKDGNNSKLIRIVDDKDVSWIMLVLSKLPDNDLLIVVDTAPATDIGNTPYMSSKLPRTEDSRTKNVIIDLNAFESPNTVIHIRVGSMFRQKTVLKKAIYMLALNSSFELVTVRSNRTSFDIRCKDPSCPWYLRASVFKKSDIWIIRKFTDTHLCSVDVVKNDHKQATSWIVSECTKLIFKTNDKAPCRPSDVINYMKIHHGVNISYDKAWRGREIALNSIKGTPEDSYAMLFAFSDALIRNNPGTYTAEEADDEGRFKFYFMALVASIDAWNYGVPVISVDGAAMKNNYLGTLISACTIDGNSQIVPLAFAVVDSENDLSWSWFFRNLKTVFREHNEMVIVSDAHKSIENGFNAVYEIAEHGLCAFHLLKNLKKNHKSLHMKDLFNKCARAYTPLEFEYYVRQLEQLSPSMRHELEAVGRHKWARAFFRRKRYQVITTNISESMNATLKEQRELPVIGF